MSSYSLKKPPWKAPPPYSQKPLLFLQLACCSSITETYLLCIPSNRYHLLIRPSTPLSWFHSNQPGGSTWLSKSPPAGKWAAKMREKNMPQMGVYTNVSNQSSTVGTKELFSIGRLFGSFHFSSSSHGHWKFCFLREFLIFQKNFYVLRRFFIVFLKYFSRFF